MKFSISINNYKEVEYHQGSSVINVIWINSAELLQAKQNLLDQNYYLP